MFTFFYAAGQQTKILWLGNSYTSVNDLPGMFHNLALSGRDSVIFDSYTPGGYTLHQQYSDTMTVAKIYSRQWDYVVLQAQSQEPSFPPQQVASQTYPYARLLDSLIRDNDSCTETVFYMTWGKKYGDQMNCSGYPILCTFNGVQSRLRESYLQMAEDNHAIVAPAGMAWYKSWHTDTLINLWQADNSHPTLEGTYLTACVFYGTIFRKTPVGLTYSPLASHDTTAFLQGVGVSVVFDSLENWNIGVFDPRAGFEFLGSDVTRTFTFTNSYPGYYNEWDFGDGTSSTTTSQHTYADTGTYTVTLTVSNGCKIDQQSQTFHIGLPTVIESIAGDQLSIYPNPVNNELLIDCKVYAADKLMLEIQNLMGQTLLRSALMGQTTKVDVSDLQSGMYILQIQGLKRKFFKL